MSVTLDVPDRGTLRRPASHRPRWLRDYQLSLIALDGSLLAAVVAVAATLRFPHGSDLHGLPYYLVAVIIGAVWWVSLALTRSYEARFLAEGPEEFRRVVQATVRVAATLGVVCYVGKFPLSRGFVALVLPLGALALPAGRWGARQVLRSRRRAGHWNHRVVVVGSLERVDELVAQLGSNLGAGLEVVAVCLSDGDAGIDAGAVAKAVRGTRADTVAVTAWPGMSPAALQELTYAVEGPGVDLVVAPSLINISGARVSIRPVAGLPLLQLREVELTGPARAVKSASDRTFALLLLLLTAPLLAVVAAALRLTGGPVLVRDRRHGELGHTFDLLRFRTRVPAPPFDPSDPRGMAQLRADDRAFTALGRVLDRTFVEDLPTLINVLRGEMAFVGPRAMLPGRRAEDPREQRRLLVRPGITGLAQVSGRSRLPVEEALRLDQQYVDNWSFGLDLLVVAKTVARVLAGRRLS